MKDNTKILFKEPRTLEMFCMIYVMFLTMMFCTSCVVLDFLTGKEPATIINEMDIDKDGKLSAEEIRNSKYDLNKDGIFSVEEMQTAMKPHIVTDITLGLMAALNVPFAAAATVALKQARQHKKNLRSVVGGIDELVALKQDGITKDDIYKGIQIFSQQMGNFKELGEAVAPIKNAIRAERILNK